MLHEKKLMHCHSSIIKNHTVLSLQGTTMCFRKLKDHHSVCWCEWYLLFTVLKCIILPVISEKKGHKNIIILDKKGTHDRLLDRYLLNGT